MAMINQTSNVKSDNEDTRGATQRSSSVGRAFTRMFSRSSSENVNANRSTSEGSVLGQEQLMSPQGSVQSVGRGRTPPRLTPLPAPSAETRETSPQPPNFPQDHPVKQQRDKFEKILGGSISQLSQSTQQATQHHQERLARAAMAASAASHRGGHPVMEAAIVPVQGDGGGSTVELLTTSEIPRTTATTTDTNTANQSTAQFTAQF